MENRTRKMNNGVCWNTEQGCFLRMAMMLRVYFADEAKFSSVGFHNQWLVLFFSYSGGAFCWTSGCININIDI